jgi:hypothetical protein
VLIVQRVLQCGAGVPRAPGCGAGVVERGPQFSTAPRHQLHRQHRTIGTSGT